MLKHHQGELINKGHMNSKYILYTLHTYILSYITVKLRTQYNYYSNYFTIQVFLF